MTYLLCYINAERALTFAPTFIVFGPVHHENHGPLPPGVHPHTAGKRARRKFSLVGTEGTMCTSRRTCLCSERRMTAHVPR